MRLVPKPGAGADYRATKTPTFRNIHNDPLPWLAATDPANLTDLERAARFLYLQRTAFGGKVAGRSFGVSAASAARFDVTKLQPLLEALHERLAAVVIECLPWSEAIARYDRPETLFHLNPPYWGSEGDCGKDLFGREDIQRLATQLAGIKGKFILSINDTPQIRQIFAAFQWGAGGAGGPVFQQKLKTLLC